MTILNDKDATTRLENTREFRESDPVFFSVLNRPVEDLEQRDADLNKILHPARGMRVRQEIPASTDIEVEPGSTVQNGLLVSFAGDTHNVPLAGVGKIRIDLVWFNLAAGISTIRTGVETPVATGFAALRADPTKCYNLPPASDAGIPLAYVYTDETVTTVYDETIAINTAGHIEDVRPGSGMNQRVFESVTANLLTDTPGGNVGISEKVVRANHRHPLNTDATVPVAIAPNNVAATGSGVNTYAYRAHTHAATVETINAGFLTDLSGGSAGVADKLCRSDHRHENNTDGIDPVDISRTTAGAGAATKYSRRDHLHKLPASLLSTVIWWGGRYTAVGIVPDFNANTVCSLPAPVVITANTFLNGIIVYAFAEMGAVPTADAGVAIQLEVLLSQGALTKRISPTPAATFVPVPGSGFADLGGAALIVDIMGNVGGAPSVNLNFLHTVNTVGIWGTGVANIVGGGGGDWNPALNTSIDFGTCYIGFIGAPGVGRVARRGIYVLGF